MHGREIEKNSLCTELIAFRCGCFKVLLCTSHLLWYTLFAMSVPVQFMKEREAHARSSVTGNVIKLKVRKSSEDKQVIMRFLTVT